MIVHTELFTMTLNKRRREKIWLERVWAWFVIPLVMMIAGSENVFADRQDVARKDVNASQERVLVVIGASYAKDWDIRSVGHYRVINRGNGGEETQQMLARFDQDVIRPRPSAVLIWGFINDIFRAPRDAIGSRQARIRDNLQKMVNKANAAGISPLLATEVLVTSPDRMWDTLLSWYGAVRGKQSYQDYVNENVRDVNKWIREFGGVRNIKVLDFERTLADGKEGRQRRYAAEDGSHLSKEAYSALTDYAETVMTR